MSGNVWHGTTQGWNIRSSKKLRKAAAERTKAHARLYRCCIEALERRALLTVAVNTEIWVAAAGGQNAIVHVDNNNGSNTATNAVTLYNGSTLIKHPTDIALDTAEGLYFFVDSDGQGSNRILEGTLAQAIGNPNGTPTFTTIYSDTLGSGANISALGLDITNHQIYFTENIVPIGQTRSVGQFNRINFAGTGLVTLATVSDAAHNAGFEDFALDLPHSTAYFVSSSAHFGTSSLTLTRNFLYKATGVTSGASSVTLTQLPVSPNDGGNSFPSNSGGVWSIDVDTTSEVFYFNTYPVNNNTNGGIYSYNINSNPTGTFSAVWLQPTPDQYKANNALAGPKGGLEKIAVDHATNTYYVDDNSSFGGVTPSQDDRVYVGSLSAIGVAPSAFLQITNINGLGPLGLTTDNQPTLSLTNSNPTFTESASNPASSNNTPVTLITGATTGDSDNTLMGGATISITSGFFAGDQLSVNLTTTSGHFTGTNAITGSYNAATGVLTLSGADTLANYQTVLNAVQFTSTSDNPTNYGTDASRTMTWTVSDGLLSSAALTSTASVVGVNDPPVNHLPAAQTANEEQNFSITGLSVTDVDANPASDSITVNLAVSHATLTVLTNVSGGLTAAGVANNGTASVTLTGTQNAINATLAAANGLVYLGAQDFNGSDTLTVTSNDQGHTGSGGAMQDQDPFGITVNLVNDVPSFTKGANQSANVATGAFSLANWATNLSAGPANESSQTVNFIVTNDSNALFSAQPAVSPTGTLTFTAAANQTGTATVTVKIHDSGGTANGGVDTSAGQTFTIAVDTAPPAAPSVPDLQSGSDSGTSQTDNDTKTANLSFDITTAEATATVQLLRNGVSVASRTGPGTLSNDTTALADGTYSYTSQQTDAAGNLGVASVALSVTIDRTSPQLVGTPSFQFNVGPQSVSYSFNENVGPSLVSHDFLVQNLTAATTLADGSKSVSGTTAVTLTFSPQLIDGNYRVTVAASDVTDLAGNALTAGSVFDFFIFAGDTDHNRTVDVSDLGNLATNYGITTGGTWIKGDSNYDGKVDVTDLGNLSSNYGKTLAPPPAPPGPAAVAGAVVAKAAVVSTHPTTSTVARPFAQATTVKEIGVSSGAPAAPSISELLDAADSRRAKRRG